MLSLTFFNPLKSGNCTLREAAIIGSVLTKVSVPVLHSGAALLKLAEIDYTGLSPPPFRVPLTPSTVSDFPLCSPLRPKQPLYPRLARQKVRPAVQGRRRAGFPLYPVQARPARHARPLAPVLPCLCPEVRLCSLPPFLLPPSSSPLAPSPTDAWGASRYKQDLTVEQKDALLDTLRVKLHPQITPEIRREIVSSVARGEEMVFDDGSMEVEIC